MNCKKYQAQIDETSGEQELSAAAFDHLAICASCRNFKIEREKLAEMLRNGLTVTAPADFNFRVKARIKNQTTDVMTIRRWQRFAFLVPTALAVLISGFVWVKNLAPQQNARQNTENYTENFSPTAITAPPSAASSPLAQDLATNLPEPAANRNTAQIVARNVNPKHKQSKDNRKTRISSVPHDVEREEIFSKDSVVKAIKPSIVSPGFDDPAAAPRKQNGRDLLQTFGIETVSGIEGLRVTSVKIESRGAKAGLETGDLIEKINGENPTAISGREFKEIVLNIKRQKQTQEIKIVSQP